MTLSVFVVIFYRFASDSNFNETGKIFGDTNYNVFIYLCSAAAAFVFCLATFLFVRKIPEGRTSDRIFAVTGLVWLVSAFVFLWFVYERESSTFAGDDLAWGFFREGLPHIPFAVLMSVFIACVFVIFKVGGYRQERYSGHCLEPRQPLSTLSWYMHRMYF